MKKSLTIILGLLLVTSMILVASGCSNSAPSETSAAPSVSESASVEQPSQTEEPMTSETEDNGLPMPEKKDEYSFYFSQRAMDHPWMVAMTTSFDMAAEKYADRISNYQWTDGSNSDAKQLADIEDILKTKPDLMFLSAQSFEPLAVVADMCKEAGVVLFCVDRRINAVPGEDYACWIGGDYRDQGRKAGEELVAALNEKYGEYKGKIAEIAGIAGASAAIDRHDGFQEVIDQYPDIEIVASQDGGFARDQALTVMENYLQKYAAGEIDAVYTHNDEMAIGAVEAIEKAGRDELLGWIVSVDGQKEALELVIDGKMLATAQCPAGYGDLSFQTAFDYLDGKTVPAEIYIPFEVFGNRTPEMLAATQEQLDFLVENDLQY